MLLTINNTAARNRGIEESEMNSTLDILIQTKISTTHINTQIKLRKFMINKSQFTETITVNLGTCNLVKRMKDNESKRKRTPQIK